MKRPQALEKTIKDAFSVFKSSLGTRRIDKGDHIFLSTHECLGVIQEEFDELKEAIHLNDKQKIQSELLDLLVATFWSLVSLRSKNMHW